MPLPFSSVEQMSPRCEPPISGIDNGVMLSSGQTPGATELQFECNPGFHLIGGPSTIWCLNTSLWSEKPPLCSNTICPELKLSPAVSTLFVGTDDGSYQAVFSCNEGRSELEDDLMTKLVCLTGVGVWSSELRPKCVVKRCDSPPKVFGALFKSQRDSLDIGTKINLECQEGFEATAETGDIVLECVGPEGVWIGLPDNKDNICKMKTCKVEQGHLKQEMNGKWSVVYSGLSSRGGDNASSVIGDASDSPLELFPLESLDLNCDPGYVLERNLKSLHCGANGILVNSGNHGAFPRCLEQHCQVPQSLPNGLYSTEGLYQGAEVVYTCNHGYKFKVKKYPQFRNSPIQDDFPKNVFFFPLSEYSHPSSQALLFPRSSLARKRSILHPKAKSSQQGRWTSGDCSRRRCLPRWRPNPFKAIHGNCGHDLRQIQAFQT